jgi:hypothetical protein
MLLEQHFGREYGWKNPDETRGRGKRRQHLRRLVRADTRRGLTPSGVLTPENLQACERLIYHLRELSVQSVNEYGQHLDEAQARIKAQLGIAGPALEQLPSLGKAVALVLPDLSRRSEHELAVWALAAIADVQPRSVYKGIRRTVKERARIKERDKANAFVADSTWPESEHILVNRAEYDRLVSPDDDELGA